MKKDYGKIALTSGGLWDAGTAYEKLTVVSKGGQAYLSFIDNVGVDPEQDCDPVTGIGTTWFRIATKGDPGTTDYNELINKPTIPTALADLLEDATHRLVTDEDKTVWNGKYSKPSTGIPKTDFENFVQQQIDSVPSILQYIEAIAAIVPEQASAENQLADKDFVNSSVSTATADFKGTFNSLEDLEQVTANANDYAFVIANDAAGNTVYKRYKWVEGTGWTWEYDLNNSSFTAAQWAAINSAITSNDVAKLSALPTKAQLDALLAQKQDTLTSGTNIKTINGESVLGSGNIAIEDKVFIASTSTPYAEVEEAYLAGKVIFVRLEYGVDDHPMCILSNINAEPYPHYNFYFTEINDRPEGKRIIEVALNYNGNGGSYNISEFYVQQNIQDLSTIRSGAAKGATAYQKPSTGIPASDIAQGVIPDVSNFITRSVNDLANYYLKSETYTKTEVQSLIGAIQQFHYEIYPNLPQSGESNVLYLIGPTGSGNDRYEEYVYANNTFVKIGDTSIDLSGYVTTQALNTELANYVTSSALTTALAAKQDTLVSGTNVKTINNQSVLGNGNLDVKDVFIAEYGVTSAQDTWNAVQAGKIVIVEKDTLYYYIEIKSDSAIKFIGLNYLNSFEFFNLTSTTWGTISSVKWQPERDKVSTITGNIDNTNYPTTKAVADYVSDIVGNINTILETI